MLQQVGEDINHKRVQRLMRLMGIYGNEAPKSLSKPNSAHQIYSYLLRKVAILRPNHVWSTDRRDGFAYLVAVIDWFSRYVLYRHHWKLIFVVQLWSGLYEQSVPKYLIKNETAEAGIQPLAY